MQLTTDQTELRDVLRRFLSEHVTPEYRRNRLASGIRSDAKLCEAIDQLGLRDGFSGSPSVFSLQELGLIAEESGRILLPESLVDRVVGMSILPQVMSAEEHNAYQAEWLGTTTAVAFDACCHLALNSDTKLLSGTLSWIQGWEGADRIVAFADTTDGRRAVVFRPQSPGVAVQPVPSLDLTLPLVRCELRDVATLCLGDQTTHALVDSIEALKASEVAGLCQYVISMTCDYVKTREQFGAPIGSFQAIQQKLADAYAATESLESLARFATWACVHSVDQRRLVARSAATHAADVGVKVCETAIQCHGGIGFTWEYDLHLYLRRAKTLQSALALSDTRATELLAAVA